MGKTIQSIPEARLLLSSLRSVGYTEEAAVADIPEPEPAMPAGGGMGGMY